MNVFNKVTLQSLYRNKTRTIVTIVGIMLSAAMICAVTTFVSSLQRFVLNYAVYTDGDWHGSVLETSFKNFPLISGNRKIANSTYNQILGLADVDSNDVYKPYIYVIGGGEGFEDMLPIHMLQGKYPESTDEIIIPDHMLAEGRLNYKVGDVITLELGYREQNGYPIDKGEEYYIFNQETNAFEENDEVIAVCETRTYTIVGTYRRASFEDYFFPGFTAITLADRDLSEYPCDIYFKMRDPADTFGYIENLGLGGKLNTDVLLYSGVSRYSNFSKMLNGLSSVVIGLIVFGSVSLIYNAFSISVAERTKQFGLLASVGATKKQLRHMVFFEALAVSVVGIPLGIGVGIAGISVTLLLIGNKFSTLTADYSEPMRIFVTWQSIVIAIVIALITVLISAWIPSRRATGISAVEAIRQSSDIKAKNKPVKTSKLNYKLFGLPGMIASKYYKRNKKKYRATVLSLFMSVVLFISAASFTDYLSESVDGGFAPNEYDIYYLFSKSDSNGKTVDEVLSVMLSDRHVTAGAYYHDFSLYGQIDKKYLTDEMIALCASNSRNEGEYVTVSGNICFVNDAEFDILLKKYSLSRDKYYNSEAPLAIALDKSISFDLKAGKYVTLDALKSDTCTIECKRLRAYDGYYLEGNDTDENGMAIFKYRSETDPHDILEVHENDAYIPFTLYSGKTITESPYYIDKTDLRQLTLIYPYSMLEHVIPEVEKNGTSFHVFRLKSDSHTESYSNIKTQLATLGLNSGNLVDYAASEESSKNVVTIIRVFSTGFIVLISLIATANVFNTVTTNINLRRREFAMLKSVGMTQKGLNRMMSFECLLYGSRALIFGLPVSAFITYLIYSSISAGFDINYHLPWYAVGLAVLSVFLVVFVTMMYGIGKIKKENPIDALKNENL